MKGISSGTILVLDLASGMRMNNQPTKLITWQKWILAFSALAVGAGWPLYREYRDKGSIDSTSIIGSAVARVIGVVVIVAIFTYANRPEPGE